MERQLRRVLEIGSRPTDSDQERVTKEVFVVIGLGASVAGAVWALMYTARGRPLSGLVPLAISVAVGGTWWAAR